MASSPTRLRVHDHDHRCESRKACFPTKNDALDMAEVLMERGRVYPGCHITPYQCDACGWWHVGNRVIVPTRGPGTGRRWR
jgi:hypothetical protein